MKNKFSKLLPLILVLPTAFFATSCSKESENQEAEETITELDDTLLLDEQIDTAKATPEGFPDPNTPEGKEFYNKFTYADLDRVSTPNQHNHETDGWIAWGNKEEEKSKLPKSGKYYLTSDIVLSDTATVPNCYDYQGVGLKICLNGHIIRMDNSSEHSIFYLNTFSYLDIYECSNADCYLKVVKDKAWEVLGVGIPKPSGYSIELGEYTLSTGDGTIVHTTGGCITGATASAIRVNRDVYFSACYLSIHGGNIVGNTTTESGGGINFGDSVGVLDGGNIIGNYAAKSGGGIALHGPYNCACEAPAFTMYSGNIIGNTCGDYGAGIFCNHNFKTVINGGVIRGNKSPKYGGGIYSSTRRGFTVNGGTQTVIEYNQAQLGGGIYTNSSSEFILNDCIIRNNKAVNGGGLYAGKTGTINNCDINNNVASGNRGGGGGIYFRSTANVIVKNISVTANSANYGGALDISNGAIVKIYGGSFTNNKASKLGGGACVVAGGSLTLGGTSKITGNTLNGKANNIYLHSEVHLSVGSGSGDDVSLAEGAALGLTLEKLPGEGEKIIFSNNGKDADTKYFSVDNNSSAYTIESISSSLSVIKK